VGKELWFELGLKLVGVHLNNKQGIRVHVHAIPGTWQAYIGDCYLRLALGKK
jgi:hypothetical protein